MKRTTAYLIAALLAVFACTGVDFREQDTPENPKFAIKTVLDVDWSNVDPETWEELPAVLNLAMARTTKAWHFFERNQRPLEDTIRLWDTLKVYQEGEYQSLIYADAAPWDYENVDTFQVDNNISLRTLYATVPKSNTSFNVPGNPIDFDQILSEDYDTLANAPKLWRADLRQSFVSLSDTNKVQPMLFRPQQMVQTVTVSVVITCPDNMVLNRVVANIVGVPYRVELLSGLIDADRSHLGQIQFELEKDTELDVWEGTIDILGIVPPLDTTARVDAGVIHMIVDEGETHFPILIEHNLKKILDARPLLQTTDVENWSRGAERTIVMELGNFYIDGSGSVIGRDDPVNPWTEPDNGTGDTTPIDDGGKDG